MWRQKTDKEEENPKFNLVGLRIQSRRKWPLKRELTTYTLLDAAVHLWCVLQFDWRRMLSVGPKTLIFVRSYVCIVCLSCWFSHVFVQRIALFFQIWRLELWPVGAPRPIQSDVNFNLFSYYLIAKLRPFWISSVPGRRQWELLLISFVFLFLSRVENFFFP